MKILIKTITTITARMNFIGLNLKQTQFTKANAGKIAKPKMIGIRKEDISCDLMYSHVPLIAPKIVNIATPGKNSSRLALYIFSSEGIVSYDIKRIFLSLITEIKGRTNIKKITASMTNIGTVLKRIHGIAKMVMTNAKGHIFDNNFFIFTKTCIDKSIRLQDRAQIASGI